MFAYCNNNPVIFVDRSGRFPVFALITIFVVCVLSLTACSKQGAQHTTTQPTKSTTISTSTNFEETVVPETPDYNDFLDALGFRESSNNYAAKNRYGYLGRYQMGKMALQDAGFFDKNNHWTSLANSYGVYNENDFLNSPEAQDIAIANYHRRLRKYIKNYGMDSYIGSTYQGVVITESGLLAACHLVGTGGVKAALENGTVITDANGTTASEYMKLFSGYDISVIWG